MKFYPLSIFRWASERADVTGGDPDQEESESDFNANGDTEGDVGSTLSGPSQFDPEKPVILLYE